MTFGLIDLGHRLPKGQVVKLIFFAPWVTLHLQPTIPLNQESFCVGQPILVV